MAFWKSQAVGMAARREPARATQSATVESFADRVRRAQAIYASSPVLDDRTPDEIIGYDEFGLPA